MINKIKLKKLIKNEQDKNETIKNKIKNNIINTFEKEWNESIKLNSDINDNRVVFNINFILSKNDRNDYNTNVIFNIENDLINNDKNTTDKNTIDKNTIDKNTNIEHLANDTLEIQDIREIKGKNEEIQDKTEVKEVKEVKEDKEDKQDKEEKKQDKEKIDKEKRNIERVIKNEIFQIEIKDIKQIQTNDYEYEIEVEEDIAECEAKPKVHHAEQTFGEHQAEQTFGENKNITSNPIMIKQPVIKENDVISPSQNELKIVKVRDDTSFYNQVMKSELSKYDKFRKLYSNRIEELKLFQPNEKALSKYPTVKIIDMDLYDSNEEFVIVNVCGFDYLYHPKKQFWCGDRYPINIFDNQNKMIYQYNIWNIFTPISDNFKISIKSYCAYSFDNCGRKTLTGQIIEND